jgi:hypothetical protein
MPITAFIHPVTIPAAAASMAASKRANRLLFSHLNPHQTRHNCLKPATGMHFTDQWQSQACTKAGTQQKSSETPCIYYKRASKMNLASGY